ncbi:FAD:protein FMN transferase [Candidatus Hartigia pinicola]|nr:FAD:protein FMN transferase [Candidatus Hartigia pinicola]
MLKTVIIPVIFFTAIFLLVSCSEPKQVNLQGQTMGTYYSIKYVTNFLSPTQEYIKLEINNLLKEINHQMSTYRQDSELSQFNQFKKVNIPFPVSAATAKVVKESIKINKLTNGALDITVGHFVNLWGFGPDGRITKVPSHDKLAKCRAWVGIEKLSVQNNNLFKTIPQLYVDLSSIAKGYSVDVISEYLESISINNYMVNLGGEVRTKGRNGQDIPWRIAIEKPISYELCQIAQKVISLGDMSIATSGDYRNYFEQDGIRFSHTINPQTGIPIKHNLASITVIASQCMIADGLSTAFNVLGAVDAVTFAEKMDIPIFVIVRTGNGLKEYYSKAFKQFLKK